MLSAWEERKHDWSSGRDGERAKTVKRRAARARECQSVECSTPETHGRGLPSRGIGTKADPRAGGSPRGLGGSARRGKGWALCAGTSAGSCPRRGEVGSRTLRGDRG